MRIYDWRRTLWRRVSSAEKSDDLVLCRWTNSRNDVLKYRLAHPDDDHQYEIVTPGGEIIRGFQTRAEVREAAADWLRENGRPGNRNYKSAEELKA